MNPIIKFIKKLLRTSHAKKIAIDDRFIVPCTKHHISKADISNNALLVLNRLINAGFQAYLVGGSVRDLLLRKTPKDFDIATNATPNQIKRLFRNARIIGRRFKLVHVIYYREIIEVATFRGHDLIEENHRKNHHGMLIRDNVFGTIEEDAWRRDLTINSLYYNIEDSSIVDYTGGVLDIHNKTVRMIGDAKARYQEDPVRMLRALRFCAKLHFELDAHTASPLKELASTITLVSGSRLFDEMTKYYQCGESIRAHNLLISHDLFPYLFPATHALMDSEHPVHAFIGLALESTDTRVKANKPITPAFIFAVILWFPMIDYSNQLKAEGLDPLPAIEKAMSVILSSQTKIIAIPKRFTQMIREIWIMQFRFPRRSGNRAFHLLEHPRFRAAYDFLALRALAGDESMALADWWTSFQDLELDDQNKMIAALTESSPVTKKRKSKKPDHE